MRNKAIKQHLCQAIQAAPIGILESVQNQHVDKMIQHDWITDQIRTKEKRSILKPVFSLGLAGALVFSVFFWWLFPYTVVDSVVYFDINPEFELSVNAKEQVIRLEGLNQEGQRVIDSVDYKRKSLYAVTVSLLEELSEEGYLETPQDVMLVSVMNDQTEKSMVQRKKLGDVIDEYMQKHQINPVVLSQSVVRSNTLVEFADQNHVSIGRMNLIRNLMILNPKFELENLVNLSLQELIQLSDQTGLNLRDIVDDSRNTPDNQPEDHGDSRKIISTDEARQIVLDLVRGTITSFGIKETSNGPVYEAHVFQNELSYEIVLDAYSGAVLKYVVDEQSTDGTGRTEEPISREQAIAIARSKVGGGGTVVEFERERDDEKDIYEIIIIKDGKEYEFEIDATTGRILEYEMDANEDEVEDYHGENELSDLIGKERAIAIVKGIIGGGTVTEFEMDTEDGNMIYEMEIEMAETEYTFKMDAVTGRILEQETDD